MSLSAAMSACAKRRQIVDFTAAVPSGDSAMSAYAYRAVTVPPICYHRTNQPATRPRMVAHRHAGRRTAYLPGMPMPIRFVTSLTALIALLCAVVPAAGGQTIKLGEINE